MIRIHYILFLLLFCFGASAQNIDELLKAGDRNMRSSDYEKAIEYYERANALCGSKCDLRKRQTIHLKRAVAYKVDEQFPEATEAFSEVTKLTSRIDDHDLQIYTKVQLGEFYRAIGELSKALSTFKSIEKENSLSEMSKNTQIEFYNRYAAVISQIGSDPEFVIDYSNKAIQLAKEVGDDHMHALSLNEIGYVKEHQSRPLDAARYYREAAKIWEDNNEIRYASNAYNNLSRLYTRQNQFDSARIYADKGIELIQDRPWSRMLSELYLQKIMAHQGLGQYKELSDAYYHYHIQVSNTRNKEWTDKMAKISAELELEENHELLEQAKRKEQEAQKELSRNRERSRNLFILLVFVFVVVLIISLLIVRMRLQNRRLVDSISERDLLLREVHHRVKNNMQVVSSLLELQSNFAKDDNSRDALVESKDRINSMAMAHQNLYNDGKYDSLEIKEYLDRLIKSLRPGDVNLNCDIDPGYLDIDKAQALGFVVNELITNSIKHAWVNEMKDKLIWIKLKYFDNEWHFFYSDNGIGILNKQKFLESPTFGITIIRSFLRRNLKGSLEFGEKPGMNLGFTFK